MRFLVDNEFIILMAHNIHRTYEGDTYHVSTLEERIRMRDAGIQTSHEQPSWNSIEPSQGSYDFAYLDDMINLNREAGMKSLIQLSGWRPPKWMPNDWFPKTKDGVVERDVLSFWNEEAQKYSDAFYQFMIERYKSYKDIIFFFGEWQGGEGAYPPTWCFYDNVALDDYKKTYGSSAIPEPETSDTMDWFGKKIIEHYVRKGKFFYNAYGNVWNEQQRLMDNWTKSFGNFVHLDTLKTYHQLWPDCNIVLLQYTYFDSSHDQDCKDFVDRLVDVSQCEVIVEAMYCKGLPITTPQAIAKGFRGQILHPAPERFSGEALKDWMIDNIKTSHRLWMESREL